MPELAAGQGRHCGGIAVPPEAKREVSQIDRLSLTGAFGNYVDRKKVVISGMFPRIAIDRIPPRGQRDRRGAGLCPLSVGERKMVTRIAMLVKPVELPTHKGSKAI